MKTNMYSKLGPNIKALRTAFGETQLELHLALGLRGCTPSTISQYENGKRFPDKDTLKKISKHYMVTETELLNNDLSDFKFPIEDIEITEHNVEMFEKMLPMVTSSKALQNTAFQKAYKIHRQLYNGIIEGSSVDENKISECLSLYKKSEKEGIVEATANLLWWIISNGICVSFFSPTFLDLSERFSQQKISVKELLKLGVLPSFDCEQDSSENGFNPIEKQEFLEENEVEMLVCIYKLKNSSEYSDLADFYLSLIYIFNLTSDKNTAELNKAFGYKMLSVFSLLGNKYAKKFLK